jgi:iron complex transport system substrate-binding protein
VVRIASLLPSATEIAFALGLGESVVAVTFECNHPGDPRVGRPVVVGGIDTAGLDAGAIDTAVRARLAAGENLYTLDLDALAACHADLVLTQDLCRVCALAADEVGAAMAAIGPGPHVVTLDPHTLDDVLASIVAVGEAAGVPERAGEIVAELQARLAAVTAAVAAGPTADAAPTVFVLEWPDPPFGAGHWVPDLVTAAGGRPVLGAAGARSVPTTWDAIASADPDIVLVASCGFGLDGTREHAKGVCAQLPARTEVWAIDADGLVVRPGPRVVTGVEAMAGAFHGVGPVDPTMVECVRRGRR